MKADGYVGQVTNYELGVMFPLKTEEELNTLPCWERPAKKYVSGKDEPWVRGVFLPFSKLLLTCSIDTGRIRIHSSAELVMMVNPDPSELSLERYESLCH